MSIRIGSNIAAVKAHRGLDRSTLRQSQSLERLSSGQRINRASDDAAGLAISLNLRASSRVFNQALRNIQDAISALNIADGAQQELSSVIVRIKELSEQSANGVYGAAQRAALDNEAQQLAQEYNRIRATTKFNGINLLENNSLTLAIQGGGDGSTSSLLQTQLGSLRSFSTASTTTTSTGDGTFKAPTTAVVGNAHSMAFGDFNGDGNVDFIGGSTIGVLSLGNGDGTFKAATTLVTGLPGTATSFVRAGVTDLDADGKLDIILGGDDAPDAVSVLMGNGDGTFKVGVTYVAGNNQNMFSFRDVNGDNFMDVLLASEIDDALNVFLGNGDGTLKARVTYHTVNTANGFRMGDVTGDGIADAVIAANSVGIVVLAGNSNGTFKAAISSDNGLAMRQLVLTDLNGDGKLDTSFADSTSGGLAVLFGNGDGTFAAPVTYGPGAAGGLAYWVTSGDLNGDGFTDLVDARTDDRVRVYFNNGNGTFKASISFNVRAENTVELVDVNNDDALDIITSDRPGTPATFILLGNSQNSNSETAASFSLLTQANSREALDTMSDFTDSLVQSRGQIGAWQNRLLSAIATVSTIRQNYMAADSRIVDADIAGESSNKIASDILIQLGTSILAQANNEPRIALQLLQAS